MPKVRTQVLAVFIGMLTLVVVGNGRAQQSADLDYIKRLLDRQRQIEAEREELTKLSNTLATRELQLKQEDADIKREHEQNRREIERGKVEASQHSAQVAQFNAQCTGRPLTQYEYAQCVQQKNGLDTWKSRLDNLWWTLQRQYESLQQRQAGLTENTLAWARERKDVDGKFSDWHRRRDEWIAEVRRLMGSPSLEDLKQRAGASAVCASLASLEAAVQCLQAVWDGARKAY